MESSPLAVWQQPALAPKPERSGGRVQRTGPDRHCAYVSERIAHTLDFCGLSSIMMAQLECVMAPGEASPPALCNAQRKCRCSPRPRETFALGFQTYPGNSDGV